MISNPCCMNPWRLSDHLDDQYKALRAVASSLFIENFCLIIYKSMVSEQLLLQSQ